MARNRDVEQDEVLPGAARARPLASLSDRALVDAMRARDGDAVEEFIRRFQHLVFVQARRLRIPPGERRRWVSDLLVEVASALARRTRDAPRAIAPYLVTAAKRKAFAERRLELSRERLTTAHASDVSDAGERAIAEATSEASIRAAHGAAWDAPAPPEALVHLLERLDARMTPGERLLLSWMAHRVPYGTIARWLGITRAAAMKRGTRLRARLVELTLDLGAAFEPAERAELLRFLRRSGRFAEHELARVDGDAPDRRAPAARGRPARGPASANEAVVVETSAVDAGRRRVAERGTTYPLEAEGNERGDHGTK